MKFKRLGMAWVTALAMCCTSHGIAQSTADVDWTRRMADSVIQRWPDGTMVRGSDKIGDWAYDKNVVFSGMTELWQNTADPKYFRYIQTSMDKLVTPDGQLPFYKADEVSLDEIALGRELLMLYGRTRKPQYYKAATILRKQLEEQARTPSKGFWHKKRYPNQMWLDGLFMAEPFYAQWAQLFQEPQDFDDIAHQFILIEEHTRDPKTGLLYHAWDESKTMQWADKKTGDSPNFWGRAMGWYAMALVDTLPYFPKDHPGRAQLIAILQRLAPAIVKVQDPQTGLWWEVLDKAKQEGNYLESSASCMFTYALAKGVRRGYLDPKFQQNARKAYDGILKKFVEQKADGTWTLTETVYGAGLGGNPYRDGSYEYYVHERKGADDPKGIGAFLLASAEMDLAPTATFARGTNVVLDAWFNSQKRELPNGKSDYFHYKWNDLADSGFSTFGHIFRMYGAETNTLYDEPTLENLKSAKIYIIVSPDIPAKNPNPHYMNDADADQIAQWVKNGGVLVILQNDSGNSEFAKFNKLTDKFGLHYNAVLRNTVEGSHWEQGKVSVPAGTPVFKSPRTFYMKEISTITAKSPAQPMLTDKGDVLMAISAYGKGVVFGMVDPWVYNEYTDGIKLPKEYENYQGGKDLAKWVLEQAVKK